MTVGIVVDMNDVEQLQPCVNTDQSVAGFVVSIRVGYLKIRIEKYLRRLLEGHAMFRDVRCRFLRIPTKNLATQFEFNLQRNYLSLY